MFRCSVLTVIENLLLFPLLVICQQQSFLSLPVDTEVALGRTAVLTCQVSNQAGNTQWAKDGVLLGYDRSVPGFPRASMVGDATQGVHNLQIINAQMEDEGEYQCQVSPTEDNLALSASCRLTVLLPATSIEICDHVNRSKVRLHQSETLTLKCEVKGGKPAATINWYRNSHKLRPDAAEVVVSDEEEEQRQTALSTLTLHPLPSDNGVTYTCQGTHPALTRSLRFSVLLDVLFPPGRPLIEGYRDGDPVRMGDTVPLRCVSRGGNPLAQLIWKKNGVNIDHSYMTSDWESINTHSVTADASDNGAIYMCEASSILSTEAMFTSVTFTVLYSPEKVTITGPEEAKAGDTVTLTCSTARSNPASEVSWVVDGRPMSSANEVEAYEGGGWTTTAEVTVNITDQERNAKLFSCYAVNRILGETVVETFSISILYAPDPPAIFGYLEGSPIRAGSLQRLTCVSHGGNPLPTLQWFKGDAEVTEVQVTSNGNVVSGEITVIAEDNDNGAEYRCQTSSTATPNPLSSKITLTVHFPPSAVIIEMDPEKPKAGHMVNITCESSSSNPPANVTWWRGGDQIESFADGTSPGAHGGTTTRSVVVLNVTEEDDKSILTCQATNYPIQQSVHDSVTLSIQYKPKFPVDDRLTAEISEGESWLLNLTCQANPSEVSYVWTKNDETIWDGPMVNVSSVRRNDSGEYVCKATNDIGTSLITILLQVKYPVTVRTSKEFVLAERNSNPQLECLAEGYPLPDDVITWKRDSFDMTRTKTHAIKGGSRLTVTNVTKGDSGEFICVGQNGVGEEDTKTITLLVQHEPIIVRSEETPYVILSDRKVSAKIACRAEGVPDISFQWMKEGVIIKEDSDELMLEVSRISPILWEGILTVKEIKTKDLGEYRCVARNNMGFDVTNFTLEADSSPDPPLVVRISNVSYDSMLVSWVPGFDGGHDVSFCVRYASSAAPDITMLLDVHPSNITSTWIRGLKPNTEYIFSVKSLNIRGSSEYSTDIVKATTLPKPSNGRPKSRPDNGERFGATLSELLITTVAVVFVTLLVLNMILMACYYRKRRRAKRKQSTSDISVSSGSHSDEESSEDITLSDLTDKTTKLSSSPYTSTEFLESTDKSAHSESYTSVTSITKPESYSDWEKYSSYSEDYEAPVGFHV